MSNDDLQTDLFISSFRIGSEVRSPPPGSPSSSIVFHQDHGSNFHVSCSIMQRTSAAVASASAPRSPWRFGLFYIDAADHRLFVPKRIRWLGWTLNFGHPRAGTLCAALSMLALLFFFYRFLMKN
jgi:hypothetical protein